MARSSKPWFNNERGAWMVWWNGRKLRLVDGKNDKATEKLAVERLADLRYQARHNRPDGSEATVASVIEAYLASASRRLAQSTQDTHFPYLQSFAEAHGYREVGDASVVHLEQWLFDHPEWVSDGLNCGASFERFLKRAPDGLEVSRCSTFAPLVGSVMLDSSVARYFVSWSSHVRRYPHLVAD